MPIFGSFSSDECVTAVAQRTLNRTSRMPELGTYGSVRGAAGNSRPYRECRYPRRAVSRQRATEALAAFEATLKKEPNRLGAYVGAAKAAEKAGDNAKAEEYYKKVVAIAGDADKSRIEVSDAHAFLTKKS